MSGYWLLENTTDTTPPAATPTFLPVSGAYVQPLTVLIFDSSPSATIYYTTDGTTPTTGSTVYSGAVSIPVGTTTLRAIATAPGFTQSAVAASAYSVATPLPPPPPVPPPAPPTGSPIRVQAIAAGFFGSDWKDIGDVFDITDPSQFSDSAQSVVPVGNPDYPLYGWMMIVPSTTPLFSYASTGMSTPRNAPRRTVV